MIQGDVAQSEPEVASAVSDNSSVQSINQQPEEVVMEVRESAKPMEIVGNNVYQKFYKHKSNKVYSYAPNEDKSFKVTEEYDLNNGDQSSYFLHRIISLPNDKIFIIGGASDDKATITKKDTYELVKDPVTGIRTVVQKANMWQSRAAFGIAVYPNFSQIFVAGGTIN